MDIATGTTLQRKPVRTWNRAGGCSVCQQTVLLRPNTGHGHVPVHPSDPVYGQPVAEWLLVEHEIAGVRCHGSGEIPEGISEPLDDNRVGLVLDRVVHRL